MFLKNMRIDSDQGLIRNISFHKGVNLIVDETPAKDRQSSGNNVGKTTTLRLIDFCLAGNDKTIYQDPEFKDHRNKKVESFLKENNVVITLTLKDNLDQPLSREIEIRRNFLLRKEKIIEVNGESLSNEKKLDAHLKEIIFDTKVAKPTFKQIKAKNIRNENSRLINTVRVLDAYTSNDEYEALYLFWLGIPVDKAEEKQMLLTKIRNEETLRKKIKEEYTTSQVEQSLIVIDNQIKRKEQAKKDFIQSEHYEEDIENLNKIKISVGKVSAEISKLEFRKMLIEESAQELSKEKSAIDSDRVKDLYLEAKSLIPTIQKTFEETLAFHNQMIELKKKYITEELPSIETSLIKLRKELSDLVSNERHLNKKLKKSGTHQNFERIVLDLNKDYELKGRLEEKKKTWELSDERLNNYQKRLNNIDLSISDMDDLIQERVRIFNKYFSEVSEELYGESFILTAEKGAKGYALRTSELVSNPGTGKKKGEMAAFDLAYIKFADSLKLKCLHFILQDQIENVHQNQITSLLEDVISKNNAQYVFSVLKDKLPADIDIDAYEILSLSQDNKLFKLA